MYSGIYTLEDLTPMEDHAQKQQTKGLEVYVYKTNVSIPWMEYHIDYTWLNIMSSSNGKM